MRGPYQILLPLLGLFLVRVDLTDLYPLKLEVKVLKIYDGDTVLVGHGSLKYKVRFSRIDSPEKSQKYLSGIGSAGMDSKYCLKKLLTKDTYTLKIEKHDMYGRLLGDLDNLSYDLISKGCTTLYPYAQFSSREEKSTFLLALKEARRKKLGLWNHGGFRRPGLWRKISKRTLRRQ